MNPHSPSAPLHTLLGKPFSSRTSEEQAAIVRANRARRENPPQCPPDLLPKPKKAKK